MFTKTLPRELTTNNYTFTIKAEDQSGASDTISVKITRLGSGRSPVIVGPSRITYPENGTWPVAKYSASNANKDHPYNGSIGWIVSVNPGGGDGDFFRINDEGLLLFEQPPDYEEPLDYPYDEDDESDNTYSFSLTAYETNPPSGRSQESYFSVTVTVVNVDEALEILGPSAIDYPENSTDAVYTFTLSGSEGPVTWSPPSGTDGDNFAISETGTLTFISPPDYENPLDLDGGGRHKDQPDNGYLVAITVEDGTDIKTEHVKVRVTNVNEPPEFDEGLETTISVDSDIGSSQQVGDPYTATDPDEAAFLTYSLSTNTLPFEIDQYNGQLSTKSTLTQFDRTSYTVTVLVTDNADDEGDADTATDDQITITINIVDGGSSNNAPTFPSTETGARSIDENITTVQNVGAPVAAATDDDNDDLTYTLGGTDVASFDFDAATRQIKTKSGVTYNYEAKSTYSVTVTADDDNGGTDTKAVTITLNNLEEAGTVTFLPTQPSARNQITASVTDLDGSVTVTGWQWAKADTQNGVYANINGETSAEYTPEDGDVDKFLQATATYNDGHGNGKTATAKTGAVQSGTNRAPTFDDGLTTTRDVEENTATGGNVGAVVGATDLDSDTLTYSLTGADASSFTIDSTGQIKVGTSTTLNFESAKKSYTVIAQVQDGKNANGGADTTIDDAIVVTINVTNVNEKPTFTDTDPTARSVAENTQAGVDIGNAIAATDPESDTLTYTLSGTNAADFDIVGTSGQLQTKSALDKEDKASYQVTVSVHDSKDAAGSSDTTVDDTITVNITVTEENDPPEFSGTTATREIAENPTAVTNVGDPLTATDDDTDDTLTYSLQGTDKDSFTIVTGTGQIQTKSGVTYNHEDKDSYSVTVKVVDSKGGTDTIAVTITLTNVEEPGTVRLSPTQPTARSPVTATLTDPDIVSGTPTWQWGKSSDGNSPWTTVGTNSDSYTPPDADLNNYLRATATYTDGEGSGKTATAKTVAAVQSGTNRSPTFDDGLTTTREVAENSTATANVGAAVGASDLDNDSLIYSLTGQDAGLFTIGASDGQVKVKTGTTLNYEGTRNSYTVIVQVHDGKDPSGSPDPAIDDVIVVTINVTNLDEDGTVSLSMTHPSARTQLTATLTDPDGGVTNESWQWAKSDAQDGTYADIPNATSDTYTPQDGEVSKWLKAKVTYTDAEASGKSAEEVSANAVQAGTNRAPTFATGTVTRTVPENSAANVNVGSPVTATDQDTGNTLEYSLDTTGATLFDINSTTGQIKTKSGVTYDHETTPTYSVTVKADDQNGGTATKAVTINLTDVEEVGTVSLSTTQPKARTQLTATLTDPDGGVTGTTWAWASSSTAQGSYTAIRGATSATYTPVDGDLNKFLKATATYTDRRGESKTASAVTDNAVGTGTNRAPEFDGTATIRAFDENTLPGLPVGIPVEATDDDKDVLTYTLDGTDAGSFEIVPTSGQIKTKDGVTYNHEAKDSYSVIVKADDKNGGTDTIAVTINVTDVNEKPSFTATPPVTFSIAENSSANTNIGTAVGATDPDDGDTLLYSLDSDSAAIFNIDSSNGQLKTKAALDKETKATYTVTVSVRDNRDVNGEADAANDASIEVTINVTDVNEPPAFPSTETGIRNVAEGTAANQDIGNPVKAVDPDVGATLTYTLGGTDAASFDFDTATGQLKTKAALDKETKATYTVTVSVRDSKDASGSADTDTDDTITVTINVTDANEPPVLSGSAAVDYAENGTGPVSTYTAVDPEGATIEWSLKGTDAAKFTIDGGVLAFKESPDYEDSLNTDKTYSVTVVATDKTNSVERAVTVTITDANDPPYFDTSTTGRTVNENTLPGGDVGLPVSANDVDAVDTLKYSLGGEESAYFGINSSTGQITVGAGIGLNFETRRRYVVTVTATDTSLTSATITVTIEVNNVDEPGTVALSQSQPQVDTPLVATLDDPDGDFVSSTTWKWEISSTGTGGWSTIANATTASYTPVDADVGKYLRVTASYDDGHGTGKSAQAAPADAVRDVPPTNDAPEFPSSENGARSVAENSAAGVNVGAAVAATDANSGDTLTYTLGGVDEPSFTIVSNNGQIQTKVPLDHESKSSYTVTVTATDPSRESDTVTVTITVTDVNEPPLAPGIPAMTRNSQTSLTMAWTAPGSAGLPAVTDYDYRYKKDTETNWAEVTDTSITDTSVEITGLEVTTHYDVQVRAKNNEGTGDWSLTGIGVTRASPNAAPAFPTQTTTRHVSETAQAQENIGNPVDAQDTDNDDLTYILEGFDANSFMIDPDTGQLKTMMPLDHETKDTYSVMVKAVDGQGGSDSISVNINVLDVNEPPVFSGNLGVHSVPENTGPGVDIGAPVTATDPEDDPLTYSLDSAGAQVFTINASTGQLQTKAALDYETARVHSVTVYVSDRKDDAGNADTAMDDNVSVTITVTNVNEPPTFADVALTRNIDENSPTGTSVGDPVTATDPEEDTLTYSLGGTDAGDFRIDASSGQLKTRTALDYESAKKSYTVTVSATDGKNADGNPDPAVDATVTVTIMVADVDEQPIVTIRSTVRYAENDTSPVDTYAVTDPENGIINWDLSGTDVDDFEISKVNGDGVLEFKTPPNFEAPADDDSNNVYLVTVEVSDGTNTDNLNVAVTVFNVNEPPAFPAETDNRSIDENTAAGQNVGGAVTATDPEGHTLTYKLAGTDWASFDIDTSTGQLKTKAPLDYETKSTYLVTVQVRDSLDRDNRVNAVTDDTINITININNVEEPGRIEFSSRQPQAATPFRATVIDPDGGVTDTTWKWERSPDKGAWTTITGATSASYTPDATDDDGKYLRVTASYTDGEGSGKSAVGVSDNPVRAEPTTNDAPEFDSTTATRDVDEGTAAGQPIGDPVAATDADTGDANMLTYSMTGADAASFDINGATGQLLTKAPLDHETKNSYSVTVRVVDPSLESDTIAVTITVNDVDEPPTLSGPEVVDYPENRTDAVAQYTADDPEGDQIAWLLEGDDKDLFEISSTGKLTFKSSPDHDIAGDDDGNNIYLVTVKVTARTSSVTLDVEITVSNVNEAPAFPDTEDGQRTVPENTAGDENIGDPVAATDPDSGDTLTYMLGGTDAASFAIDEATGQLKTKAGVIYDHEGKDTYTVTVTVTDHSGLSNSKDVTITISSVNEPPEFSDGATTSRSVAENTPAVQDIGAPVAATDPEDDTLTYTLGGDDAASFTIDESDGQLKTFDPLDYEFKTSYSVTVSASDSKDIDGNADTVIDKTIDVTITVTDQDEAGTVILSSLQPQVDTALTATLVEPDDAANVTWTWHSSSDWSSGWTAISGATSDTYTPVTGDVGNYLRATATFTNSQNAQVSAHGISAYPVRAAPANNAAPAFPAATATRSVPEDTPVGNVVGDPVTATDTDADDVLTYTLSGTDAESFTIGTASGQLRTNTELDRETKSSYTVVVTATDPSGESDTITVTIIVTDANEPPVISGDTSVYYSEARTDAVATYTADDPENGQITWSLAGDDSGDFSISNTGDLTFSTQPDRENPADADTDNVYLVTVQASDGPNTVSLDVVVTVTDAADPPPAPDAPTVEAAATDGHTALSVSWQAPTITGSSPITGYDVEYRKQGAEVWSDENVTITGTTAAITGVLPDTVYEAQVRAENTDGWGAWSEPGTGRTDVTPLDQQIDLTVSYQAAGYTVNEGATGNVSVRLSVAADRRLQIPITVTPLTAESGDYQVSGLTSNALAFVPGDSSRSFTFEGLQDTDTTDETVTLGFGQSLPDKVTAGSPSSSVVSIDDDDTSTPSRGRSSSGGGGGGGSWGGSRSYGSSSSTNKAPVFTEGDSATRSVAENTAAGVNIGEPVRGTDADKDDLRYTVGGDDGSAFSVDSDTGQLKTKSALDFERKSSYSVTMGVFDGNGGSDTINVTISVTDVTDVPLASGSTQIMGVVDSEQDTTVSTLDGSVAVTFPSGSRSGDYQVRLDYGTTNCDLSVSGEQLWFCLTVDIFDNEGNLEQGVVLSQAATIKIRRNADERGGVDAVLALHAQGGVNVYTRGRTGGEWTDQAFTLESDDTGGIVITITGCEQLRLVRRHNRLTGPNAGLPPDLCGDQGNNHAWQHDRPSSFAGTNTDTDAPADTGRPIIHTRSHPHARAGAHAGTEPEAGANDRSNRIVAAWARGWAGGNTNFHADTVRHRQGARKSAAGASAGR